MDSQLKERISELSDEELLEMVERKTADYRREALDYAAAELEARGIPFSLRANVVIDETVQSPVANAINVDIVTPHGEVETQSIKKDLVPLPVVGKYLLAQDKVELYADASTSSSVLTTAWKGEILKVKESSIAKGNGWLRVRQSTSFVGDGFIPSDTQMEQVVTRFRIERVTFIIIVSVIASLIFGPAALVVAVPLTFLFVVGKTLFGFDLFFETIPADMATPQFDWRRLVREPLKFLVILLAVVLLMILIAGVKALF